MVIILQGLGVTQAAVTERWPSKEEKTPEKDFFFVKKNIIYGMELNNMTVGPKTPCF